MPPSASGEASSLSGATARRSRRGSRLEHLWFQRRRALARFRRRAPTTPWSWSACSNSGARLKASGWCLPAPAIRAQRPLGRRAGALHPCLETLAQLLQLRRDDRDAIWVPLALTFPILLVIVLRRVPRSVR